jgi:SET domain-containing protein
MADVVIKEVKGKGKGIFAKRNFKKGEKILYFTGKIIETDKPREFSEEIREHWAPIKRRGKKISYIIPESPWMYMNHSCESNAGLKTDRQLVAVRDIKKGEEITIDYSIIDIEAITEGRTRLSMICKCGSKNCRKIIRRYDKLPKKVQERLKPYVSSYIKKKFVKD